MPRESRTDFQEKPLDGWVQVRVRGERGSKPTRGECKDGEEKKR